MRKLTDSEKTQAIELALQGESTGKIAQALGIAKNTFWLMRLEDTFFQDQLAQAQAESQHDKVNDLENIARTEPDVQRAKLITEVIRWKASKLVPKTYGDRIDVNISAPVSVAGALTAARSRVLHSCYPEKIIDAEIVETKQLTDNKQPDEQSDDAESDPTKKAEIDIFS